ncbi:MAG: hypothetical protein WD336_09015, partial [Trueperaceae bacterium]
MKLHRIAPAEIVRGDDAVPAGVARIAAHQAGTAYDDPTVPELQEPVLPQAAHRGPPSVLLVHGPHGYDVVRERLDAALDAAGIHVTHHEHHGPTHADAIREAARAGVQADAGWIVGVGGGRV